MVLLKQLQTQTQSDVLERLELHKESLARFCFTSVCERVCEKDTGLEKKVYLTDKTGELNATSAYRSVA